MATLSEHKRRTAFFFVIPFPPYKRNTVMRNAYPFVSLNMYDFSDFSAIDNFFRFSIKRRIAQNVADHNFVVMLVRHFF